MSQDHHQNPSTRRIILPSGRAIELIRLDDRPEAGTRELHLCPACGSDLVQPLSWSELADGRFELVLACPNCDWQESGAYERRQVELLEDRMDEALSDMIADLKHLAEANMTAEIERFAAALAADLILPEDF